MVDQKLLIFVVQRRPVHNQLGADSDKGWVRQFTVLVIALGS